MFYTDCQLSNDERALLSYPDSDPDVPEFEVRYNNASVASVCPICSGVFKPRIGDVLFFLGRDPVCDDCDTLPAAQAEAKPPEQSCELCPF